MHRRSRPLSGQRGVAALELALVFALFLAILFGIASFSVAFIVKQTLSRAVENGARAMLQASLARVPDKDTSPQEYGEQACRQALSGLLRFSPDVKCSVDPGAACGAGSALVCASIVATYPDYRNNPPIPVLVPLESLLLSLWNKDGNESWTPADLGAKATVQIGRADS
ncbi:hypothetical protein GCM10023144_26920 [Pigmentiphaga soli]|uniref:TadE-like domain-containing protein n=1 Tax=Pigmentiphaga soli TaxID=1007095 RepID=A0ABP8H5N7_9BURK